MERAQESQSCSLERHTGGVRKPCGCVTDSGPCICGAGGTLASSQAEERVGRGDGQTGPQCGEGRGVGSSHRPRELGPVARKGRVLHRVPGTAALMSLS